MSENQEHGSLNPSVFIFRVTQMLRTRLESLRHLSYQLITEIFQLFLCNIFLLFPPPPPPLASSFFFIFKRNSLQRCSLCLSSSVKNYFRIYHQSHDKRSNFSLLPFKNHVKISLQKSIKDLLYARQHDYNLGRFFSGYLKVFRY